MHMSGLHSLVGLIIPKLLFKAFDFFFTQITAFGFNQEYHLSLFFDKKNFFLPSVIFVNYILKELNKFKN